MIFVSWLFIRVCSCSLLDLSSQYALCRWSYLLLEYRIAVRERIWKKLCNTESHQIFFTVMQRKADIIQKYLWKKTPHKLFPMPSLLSLNAHMPRIYWKTRQTRDLKEARPRLKKTPCWLLQGEGTGSSDTRPSCLSPFYHSVCPLISLLSLPSADKKPLPTKGWTALLQNVSFSGKLVFFWQQQVPT